MIPTWPLQNTRSPRRPEQMRGEIADIGISAELSPGPALMLLVDGDALAAEGLRVERGVRRRRAPYVRNCADDLHLATFDEHRGFHTALEMGRREIGARRREAPVGMHVHRLPSTPPVALAKGKAFRHDIDNRPAVPDREEHHARTQPFHW